MLTRRQILKLMAAIPALSVYPLFAEKTQKQHLILPPALKPGDKVGLINPASAIYKETTIREIESTLQANGLAAVRGKHLLDSYGYLAGTDQDRVDDIHTFFRDPEIKAIIAARGGWGCNRILPMLDYDLIQDHPKILMGYSDITSLLLAITAKTGMVTFHGPVGISNWNEYSLYYVRRVLFEGRMMIFDNQTPNHAPERGLLEFTTVFPGVASGHIWGGNLSVLSAMVGSEYLPDPDGSILFVEDVGEDIYRIDRMLTQLKLAGILDRISGFIFAQCTHCSSEDPDHAFTIEDLMNQHIKPLGIPAFMGFLTGHINNKFTLPIGLPVAMDAGHGTVVMKQAAVQTE